MDNFFRQLDEYQRSYAQSVPPTKETTELADGLFYFLFPFLNPHPRPARIQYALLHDDLCSLLGHVLPNKSEAEIIKVSDAFFEQLPETQMLLFEDGNAMVQFDPAASCLEEVIASYPGFHAIAIYRLAHILHQLSVPMIPRMLSEYIHGRTGIDIHPAANIGRAFFIDHGTGVVIGATAIIGNNVKIYQGVTLGALQVDKAMATQKRHPTIEDGVIIYANSTILGGKTVIGHNSVIGGNTWVTQSVPPLSIVTHQPKVEIRSRKDEGSI